MSNWTHGPWTVKGDTDSGGFWRAQIMGADGRLEIALVTQDLDETRDEPRPRMTRARTEANARLVAAAPDLAEACAALIDARDRQGPSFRAFADWRMAHGSPSLEASREVPEYVAWKKASEDERQAVAKIRAALAKAGAL